MPLLSRVEKRSRRGRLLLGLAYFTLVIGSVVTVYPFLLMLSSSVASSADAGDLRVVPRYLYSEDALFQKYVDEKYQGDLDNVSALYGRDIIGIQTLSLPAPISDPQSIARWREFERGLPLSWRQPGFRGYAVHPSPLRLAYQAQMQRRFADDIAGYDRTYTEQANSFAFVSPPLERPASRLWIADDNAKLREFTAWKATLPADWLVVAGMEPIWTRYLRDEVYEGNLPAARAVWGQNIDRFDEIPLGLVPPADAAQRRDWSSFVRTRLPLRHIATDPAAIPEVSASYHEYLRRKYRNVIARLNTAYVSVSYRSFEDLPLPDVSTARGAQRLDWSDFLTSSAPIDALRADTPENRYRSFLATRGAAGATVARPPYLADDADFVCTHAAKLRANYLWRNYALVLDYILLHGRAVWVTLLFCGASVLAALIVNPFCAYALSRYDLRRGYQILLFVLATMAFPAEVTMIPSFLMLKDMHLLNTLWALVLPGVANGYAIFLLKGFFDSLPKELYEAGTLDGASELTLFRHITLPMSGAILAVIALQAFLSAYGAFMFALVVCQDSRMWTIMVWLYQMQASSPKYVVMAALTVAAVPTLLVFLFAQQVILRGILVPVEK